MTELSFDACSFQIFSVSNIGLFDLVKERQLLLLAFADEGWLSMPN